MHPILLQLGSLTIGTHDAFSVTAVAVGFAIYYAELRRRGWLDDRIVLVSLAVLAGGVLGARLITAWERVDAWAPRSPGPVAVVGADARQQEHHRCADRRLSRGRRRQAGLGYTRSTGDAYVLAMPVAMAIGRVGCFLSELPLGTPTDLPWGITVDPAAAAAFARCPGCDVAMHPSMLYEILFNLAAIPVILRRGRASRSRATC